jgi:4-amino-4-deoxy-L-arabinose transferase-like glycosyltransferase
MDNQPANASDPIEGPGATGHIPTAGTAREETRPKAYQTVRTDCRPANSSDVGIGWILAWVLLWILVLVVFLRTMSSVPLVDPDEGRNAEVAREMAESGDFVVPHLNGLPYLDKPVLLFAASALSIRALGADELAARLPTLISSLATVVLVTAFGWLRFGLRTGLIAGAMLSSSPIVLAFAGIVIFDAVLMFWVSFAAIAFHLALERAQRGWCFAGWTAVGLAVLTKGPVGLLLPMLIGIGEALACSKPLRRLFCWSGPLAFLLLVGPWFLAVTIRHPEFPHYAVVRETFERVATDSMDRTGPIYYFIPILFAGTFPWVALLLAGAPNLAAFWRERRGEEVFLLLWLLLPTIFFSLSQSKRPGYILPVIPALTLLCARILQVAPGSLRRAVGIAAPILAGLGAWLLAAPESGASVVRESLAVAEKARDLAPYLGAGLLGAAALCLLGVRWSGAALAGLAFTPLVLVLGAQGILVELGEQRSARELAGAIGEATQGRGRVVGVATYPPSLSFYLGQTLALATFNASETRSNYIKDFTARLLEAPDSSLKPLYWWYEELQRCPEDEVFLLSTRNGWEKEREQVSARLPLLYRDQKYEAYGPCGTGDA